MAIKRREVRSIVILYPKGGFFGDKETDELNEWLPRETEDQPAKAE